jgi:hypothetical protein
LEDYAQRFDTLFSSLAQRRGFRDYLQGLLLPRDRNKTLTGLAGAEPITGAQATGHPGGTGRAAVVASGAAPGAGLVDPMEHVATLLAVMVASTAAPAGATAA